MAKIPFSHFHVLFPYAFNLIKDCYLHYEAEEAMHDLRCRALGIENTFKDYKTYQKVYWARHIQPIEDFIGLGFKFSRDKYCDFEVNNLVLGPDSTYEKVWCVEECPHEDGSVLYSVQLNGELVRQPKHDGLISFFELQEYFYNQIDPTYKVTPYVKD